MIYRHKAWEAFLQGLFRGFGQSAAWAVVLGGAWVMYRWVS